MTAAASDRRAIITEALRKIDDLTARLEIAEKGDTEPIAVVGMGCRFPGGVDSPDEYWNLLQDGRSGVIRVPADRWDADAFYTDDHTVPGTICNREGGFLTSWQPDEFDAEFFGISPREAAAMDPQQRLLLEVTWEALENAGITPQTIRGTQTSVFVGLTTNDYFLTFAGKLGYSDLDPYIPFGNASNFAAGRLSYFLGVNGPAVVIDTACSSSLVSIHLACQSLRRRESDYALASGVNLILTPENSIACSRWGMLAPDGNCKTFDAGANGYVRSEGCGVVVLKRLSDAQRDGDRVLAVVRGSATNQDGASSGQTVPNGPAQQALMRRALASARLRPSDIDYVEAHGTGTALGDPIELDALSAVFGDRGDSAPLVLGSVKTNLGHLESAAGVAGFIKTVLSLSHAHIPKQLHFERLTPNAGAGAARFVIAAEPLDWPSVERPRRAGVSSFGVSGTNAHIVLEQAPVLESIAQQPEPPVSTLVVSAKSSERIATLAGALADWLDTADPDLTLADVAHTVNHHRARHPRFATVAARDRSQAIEGLRALAGGYPASGVVPSHDGVCKPGTVFVYSGQGSQWAGMGRQLLADEPAFAAAVAELEPDFVAQVGFSLLAVLQSGEQVVGIDRIQPVLVGVQLALTALWRSYGVHPDAVIGHSMGEVTAAVVAGALSVADGLKVIATRSRLMSRLSGQGAMALLELDAEATQELIADGYPDVTVAVHASPRQTVIAGTPEQVDAIVAVVDARGRLARRVEVDVASHHPIIDPVLPELRVLLADLTPTTPTIPMITTSGVQTAGGSATFDAEYWAANLRNPVRFSQAVAAAGADHGVFVEVSPHPVLTYAIDDTLADVHHHAIGTLARDTHDTLVFRTNLNATHTVKAPEFEHPPEPHPVLPTTPWHHARHWIALPEAGAPAFDSRDGWFYDLDWQARPLPTSAAGSGATWLVLDDDGQRLARLLGGNSRALPLSALEGDVALDGVQHVLFAPPAGVPTLEPEPAHQLFASARRLITALAGMTTPPKLTILTRNAQPMSEGDRANPAHATLWGLGRTLALENPEIWGGIVDADDAVPSELIAEYVRAEAVAGDGEDQVAYRSGVRHVPRLARRSPPRPVTGLPADASHLVIGATGNIGPDLIRQLADMGARTIVAVSRRGGAQLADLIADLEARGTRVVDVAADAADEAVMTALFARFGADLPPLDGVYLAALAGGANVLTEMSDDDVSAMFRPKVDAAALLHRLTLTSEVRRFVLFSSITGVLGSRWLGHYTAAGAYLDTFAYARRALGLAATVIDWGLWKSWADAQPATAAAGLEPMPNDIAIRTLPAALSPDAGVRPIIVAADWDRIAETYRMRGALRVVDDVLRDGSQSEGTADVGEPVFGTLLGAHTDGVWRARLTPQAKPYPGSHRVQGVEVVPVSVLLQTLAAAASESGLTGLRDVRFEYPIVVDQARVVQVVSDGTTLVVSSSTSASAPAHQWVRHASAVLDDTWTATSAADVVHEVRDFDAASVAELQRLWGIDGQPFDWEVRSCRSAVDGLHADVVLPEPSSASLLDAAVHIARLAGSSDERLMFPAAAAQVRFGSADVEPAGRVEVRRQGADGDALVVDVVASAGGATIEIGGLTYAALEAVQAQLPASSVAAPTGEVPDWSGMTAPQIISELETRLAALLARELGMPPTAVGLERPFPELGLDSMMAMTVLREAKHLVDMDLSATMLWNHPTVSSMAVFLADLLVQEQQPVDDDVDLMEDVGDGVLDALFDSVESASAGSESGF